MIIVPLLIFKQRRETIMNKTLKTSIALISSILISTTALALHCPKTYKGYTWDRVVMGTPDPKMLPNNVGCLYNKTGDSMLPPAVIKLIKGSFKPAGGMWSGTSSPFEITCAGSAVGCTFEIY